MIRPEWFRNRPAMCLCCWAWHIDEASTALPGHTATQCQGTDSVTAWHTVTQICLLKRSNTPITITQNTTTTTNNNNNNNNAYVLHSFVFDNKKNPWLQSMQEFSSRWDSKYSESSGVHILQHCVCSHSLKAMHIIIYYGFLLKLSQVM